MMRRVIILLELLVIAGQATEPEYQSKPVSYWLDEQKRATNFIAVQQAFGALGDSGVPYVMARLRQEDQTLTRYYRTIYAKLPQAMQRVLPRSQSYTFQDAAFALNFMNSVALTNYIRDRSVLVRRMTLQSLWVKHAATPALIPDLLGCLQDADSQVRVDACALLGQLGPAAVAAVPKLMDALQNNDFAADPIRQGEVHRMYERTLGAIGSPAHAAIPLLTCNLSSTNSSIRIHAAIALWRINHQITNTFPLLLAEVHPYGNGFDQVTMLETFAEMGPSAAAAVPALLGFVRLSLTNSFYQLYYPPVKKALLKVDASALAQVIAEIKAQNPNKDIPYDMPIPP